MRTKTLLVLFSMLAAASAQAQMYKWVDANGRVTYSDVPPPAAVRQKQMELESAEEGGEVALPYALAAASRNFPVLLYTSADCVPCDQGRAMLKQRGIPFSERTVSTNEDLAQLKQSGGDGSIPYFTVGRDGFTGFDAATWNNALTAAGYPESSILPANYRQAPPRPAAPLPATPANSGAASGERN